MEVLQSFDAERVADTKGKKQLVRISVIIECYFVFSKYKNNIKKI